MQYKPFQRGLFRYGRPRMGHPRRHHCAPSYVRLVSDQLGWVHLIVDKP